MEQRPGGKCLIFRIVIAVLGILSGLSIFFTFIAYKNVNAAIWGLLSAIFAAIVLSLHIAYRKDVLLERFPLPTLQRLTQFGLFSSMAATIAAVTYFILVAVLKQGYKLENDGYMPAGIFALLTLKWTAFLYCHSKHYVKTCSTEGETQPISNKGQYKQFNSADEKA